MKQLHSIDLHMHTTVSDGTDTPEEILSHVRALGLDLFSVTDHDAIRSGEIIPGLLTETDPMFLTGIEFSCRDEQGKYHILGYGYDPQAQPIRSVVEKGHSFRMKKTQARLDFLKEAFGFTFPEEELAALLARNNPGKPHIGNLMVKYGYAKSKDEAIRDYINQKRFRSEYVRPEEAIRGILESGGIPVLAHPSYGTGEDLIIGEALNRRIVHLMEFGLAGLEAYYSGFTAKLQGEVLSYAEQYGLYVTAGSDYHGSNKLVQLGDINLASVEQGSEGLQRFLKDCRPVNPR